MPARPKIVPNRKLTTMLPQDVSTRLDLWLWSDFEGCIPKGAYQRFLVDRINEFFSHKSLDLAPFLPGAAPGEHIVSGPLHTIAALQTALTTKERTHPE